MSVATQPGGHLNTETRRMKKRIQPADKTPTAEQTLEGAWKRHSNWRAEAHGWLREPACFSRLSRVVNAPAVALHTKSKDEINSHTQTSHRISAHKQAQAQPDSQARKTSAKEFRDSCWSSWSCCPVRETCGTENLQSLFVMKAAPPFMTRSTLLLQI